MPELRLVGMTIAVGDAEKMLAFYRSVFGAQLEPFDLGGATLYRGEMAGLSLQFCPKEFAGISAEDNIHQLSFVVDDITRVMAEAVAAGGSRVEEPRLIRGKLHAAIKDPDGNSIELAQG